MTVTHQTRIGRSNLIIETGKLAKQADGAVTVRYGDTVVLVTVVASKESKADLGYFPLSVDYREKTSAAGKIPGGFFKREGRPTEREILTARLIDRPIRPLFANGYLNEVQVMGTVLSSDGENDPDVLSIIGASSALMISGIPFQGPIGAVRIGRLNNAFVVNPTYSELEESALDLVVVASKKGVIMLEGGSSEVSEDVMLEAIALGTREIQQTLSLQEELVRSVAPVQKPFEAYTTPEPVLARVRELAGPTLTNINNTVRTKHERDEAVRQLTHEVLEAVQSSVQNGEFTEKDVLNALHDIEWKSIRDYVLTQRTRLDGRTYADLRPITSEVGVLPRTHGSSLFTRGQTQSISTTTLGTSTDEQLIESLEGKSYKHFMLHYNFPPFSVGEAKPVRGPGRREIGHGALAERALRPMIPSKEEFPYTIRVVSDILESNGSSSMATVCAGSLCLMDAGVPVKKSVAGIAMGLFHDGDRYEVLTDLSGLEDHHGDMDFKIAGTREGITAIQLDLKIDVLPHPVIERTLRQAREARLEILRKMEQTIAAPRETLSEYAPRIVTLKINPDRIRDVIGPGGKMIRSITEETDATIEVEDDGTVLIASANEEMLQLAIKRIKDLTADPEVGQVYTGKITRIMGFGAFCEILPGREGLIHVSELSEGFVESVESVVKLGDEVQVKVIEIDDMGRVNLSIRQLNVEGDPTPLQRGGGRSGEGRPPRQSDGRGRPPRGNGPRRDSREGRDQNRQREARYSS